MEIKMAKNNNFGENAVNLKFLVGEPSSKTELFKSTLGMLGCDMDKEDEKKLSALQASASKSE